MRAARLHGPSEIRIDEVPTPEARPGEVLLRVGAVTICGSDCHSYEAGPPGGAGPDHAIVPGHEFAGEVVALGDGVEAPAIGTRVVVEPGWHCGQCDMCQKGYFNVCRDATFPGAPPRDGALAEYISCPAFSTHPMPAGIGWVEGALLEPLSIGVHVVRLGDNGPGDRMAILGAGGIGVCTMLVAKALGVESITMVEPVEGRRMWAERLGASRVVESWEELRDDGFEAEVVFECSGRGEAVGQAMSLAAPAGKAVIVGLPRPSVIAFDSGIARPRELTLIFSCRSRDTVPPAADLVAEGKVDLSSFPVRRFSLDQAAEAIEMTVAQPGDALRAAVIP